MTGLFNERKKHRAMLHGSMFSLQDRELNLIRLL